jgi:hypothetical protein
MGLYNILFGGSGKKRVSEKEYRKAKGELYTEGMSKFHRAKVDEIFSPEFNERGTDAHPRGLEATEIEARLKWMRENKSKHGLSDSEITKIEDALKKHL